MKIKNKQIETKILAAIPSGTVVGWDEYYLLVTDNEPTVKGHVECVDLETGETSTYDQETSVRTFPNACLTLQ